MVLPDVSFRGKIDEEDYKDDTCAKKEDSRGEYSKVAVDRVVKENVENYCEKDYNDTGNMGDGSKNEEHHDGSSMEEMALKRRTMKMAVAWKIMALRRRTMRMEVAWKIMALRRRTMKMVVAQKMMALKRRTMKMVVAWKMMALRRRTMKMVVAWKMMALRRRT